MKIIAYVQGIARSSTGVDSKYTDAEGNCSISLTALDTGSVVITVIMCGYVTSETEYPGLPLNGTIDIGLEPEP